MGGYKKDLAYYLFQVLKKPLHLFIHFKLNLKLIKNEAKNDIGPFLITGNHVTAYDPLISLIYLKPLVKFVAADANFDHKIKRFFFNAAGIIPISKKNQDIRTIKRLITEVKRNNAVGLYPEGGRNWNGETDQLIYSTAKLIKLLKIPVYVQKLEGAYMSSPRWGKTLRKGQTNVSIVKIFESDEIEQLSETEVFQKLESELYHNDYEHQRKKLVKLKGKDHALYIERLIYLCPNCLEFATFISTCDKFKCASCNKEGKVNMFGFIEGDFKFDNLVCWDHFQKKYLTEYLKTQEIKPVVMENVIYRQSKDNLKKKQYKAKVYLENHAIILEFNNEKVIIKISEITEPSITFKNTLIFYENNIRHEFVIEPFIHYQSIVYLKDVLTILKERYNAN